MTLLRFVLGAVFAGALWMAPKPTSAACSLPYSATAHTTASSSGFNSDVSAITACFSNIDRTSIGSGGLDASDIIPTGTPGATFGGTVPIIFPNGLTAQLVATFKNGFQIDGNPCATTTNPCLDTDGTFITLNPKNSNWLYLGYRTFAMPGIGFGPTAGWGTVTATGWNLAGQLNQLAANTFATRHVLTAGTYTFTFPAAYTSIPVCTVSPEGARAAYLNVTPSTSSCIVTSSDNTDTRTVDIHIVGNPN